MKYLTLLAVPFIISCIPALADSGDSPKSVAVGITDSTGSLIGLRFTPPDAEGWTMERSGASVTLKKGSNDDSREIEAYLVRLDAPISPIARYVETVTRNIEEGVASNKRFKISALEVTEDPKDSRCARGHLLLESFQTDQAVQERKWSEQYFLSCGLPKHRGLGFELRYYHRYLDSKKDKQFGKDAIRILESTIIDDK